MAASRRLSPVSSQPVITVNRQGSGGGTVSTAADASKTAAAKEPTSSNQVAQAVVQVNEAFAQKGLSLYASFEKDKITGIDIVRIREKKSDEVIRQLPLKEMVAFAQSFELPEGWRVQGICNMT